MFIVLILNVLTISMTRITYLIFLLAVAAAYQSCKPKTAQSAVSGDAWCM
jgi:hypothetical protein